MDKTIEELFVKTFVEKRMQDRIIYELSTTDKKNRKNCELRDMVLHRFASAEDYIKAKNILLANDKMTIDEAEKNIKQLLVSTKNGYLIGTLYDGESMPLRKALEISFDYLGTSIIIANDNVAFIKTEQAFGSPMKFILHKKN